MFPFRKKLVRHKSPELTAFENALSDVGSLVASLEANHDSVSDESIRQTYFNLESALQSNCDAVASGLLSVVGAICVHAEHLTCELLPSAIQPIYYLGIEDLAGIQAYIRGVAKQADSYLDLHTEVGSQFLIRISSNEELIVTAFQSMYDLEDNQWRTEEPDVPAVPPILAGY